MSPRRLVEFGALSLALAWGAGVACSSHQRDTPRGGGGAAGSAAGTVSGSGSGRTATAGGVSVAAGAAGSTPANGAGAPATGGATGAAGQSSTAGGGGAGGAPPGGRGGGAGRSEIAGSDSTAGGTAGAVGEAGAVGVAGAAGATDASPCPGGAFTSYDRVFTERQTHSGENGTFTDRCEDGNLVEYLCESEFVAAQGYINTGQVTSMASDCEGRCMDGACPNACPVDGDSIEILSIDSSGNGTFADTVSGWSYTCTLITEAETGICTALKAGDVIEVHSTQPSTCAGPVSIMFGWDSLPKCLYDPCLATAP